MSRIILVETADGEQFEVENIPDEAKITFSSVNPQSPSKGGQSGYTLRIYQGARADNGNQIAVFQNVSQFRDKSLKVTKAEKKLWIDNDIPEAPIR